MIQCCRRCIGGRYSYIWNKLDLIESYIIVILIVFLWFVVMLVFLDEAGDPWFKFDQSSSTYFVVGLVIFEDQDDALACDQRISLLRVELWLKSNYEFHYKKDSDRIRQAFINAIAPYNFFYYGIVINKQLLRSPNMQIKESFYKYTCGLVFENAKDKLDDAIVVVDRQWGKEFEQELKTYIKKKINTTHRKVKKVKMEHSHTNNLLQIADYIASWIYHRINKPTHNHYISQLDHRKIYVQIWPKIEKSTSIPKESTS